MSTADPFLPAHPDRFPEDDVPADDVVPGGDVLGGQSGDSASDGDDSAVASPDGDSPGVRATQEDPPFRTPVAGERLSPETLADES